MKTIKQINSKLYTMKDMCPSRFGTIEGYCDGLRWLFIDAKHTKIHTEQEAKDKLVEIINEREEFVKSGCYPVMACTLTGYRHALEWFLGV